MVSVTLQRGPEGHPMLDCPICGAEPLRRLLLLAKSDRTWYLRCSACRRVFVADLVDPPRPADDAQ
ncbi:MAG: hypothetical protein JWL71_1723 [Acidobacteria bacterium]|jgi:hypothetical protein|nr:hypothetical protein [Acidobacteriota bacterium]